MTDLHRFLRHALGPFVVLAVEHGWLPESMQQDTLEAGVIALGFLVPFIWSKFLDGAGLR